MEEVIIVNINDNRQRGQRKGSFSGGAEDDLSKSMQTNKNFSILCSICLLYVHGAWYICKICKHCEVTSALNVHYITLYATSY